MHKPTSRELYISLDLLAAIVVYFEIADVLSAKFIYFICDVFSHCYTVQLDADIIFRAAR